MDLVFLVESEEKKLSDFFGERIQIPKPEITPEETEKFLLLGFDLHYLLNKEIKKELTISCWREPPRENFYQLIRKKKITENANFLPGKWILIDKRPKPKKNYWWVSKDSISVVFLKKFLKVDIKKKYQAIKNQQYQDDFLLPILKAKGFHSRFSLTWQEIDEIVLPAAAEFLQIAREKIRLPRFIEWNFLANAFYPEWGKTSTWEWLNDRFLTGECLTVGSNGLSVIGWDPPDFWSTILGFRFLIEI